MKSIILFDLDNTLFSTKIWFYELLIPVLAEALGVENEDVLKLVEEYKASLSKSTDFNHQVFLDWLHEEFGGDRAQLEALYWKKEYFEHALFDEVVPTLEQLAATHHLGVYSEGIQTFQQKKLINSGLEQWLQPELHFIFTRKLEPAAVVALPECTIIDDREDVIDVLLIQPKLTPIWLNRLSPAHHPEARTIHSLSELLI